MDKKEENTQRKRNENWKEKNDSKRTTFPLTQMVESQTTS